MRALITLVVFALVFLCVLFYGFALTSAQGGTVNADPDFDEFYSTGDGTPGVWKPFRVSTPGPKVLKHLTEGWPKGPSLWIFGDAIQFDGGVYQVVAAKPGRAYHFEVAWAVVRYGGVPVSENSQLIRQVGIDPLGGTNPLSAGVQWSGEYRGSGKFAPELAIDQYARSDHITIFIRAKNGYTDQRAEVFFDHAILTENSGMPPITVILPSPTSPPTATRQPTSTIVRTRVAVAPSATVLPTSSPTAMPSPTDTPSPTMTRTPRATATPVETESLPPEVPRLTITGVALAGICGSGVLLVALGLGFLYLNRARSRGLGG